MAHGPDNSVERNGARTVKVAILAGGKGTRLAEELLSNPLVETYLVERLA